MTTFFFRPRGATSVEDDALNNFVPRVLSGIGDDEDAVLNADARLPRCSHHLATNTLFIVVVASRLRQKEPGPAFHPRPRPRPSRVDVFLRRLRFVFSPRCEGTPVSSPTPKRLLASDRRPLPHAMESLHTNLLPFFNKGPPDACFVRLFFVALVEEKRQRVPSTGGGAFVA